MHIILRCFQMFDMYFYKFVVRWCAVYLRVRHQLTKYINICYAYDDDDAATPIIIKIFDHKWGRHM